ncbi:MAG: aspartate/glutamate racemase family protein [Acetobacteraceae bacterium]|nr:aspartate/glutamate racemase family protein [Acetobacteraceae bacterium]
MGVPVLHLIREAASELARLCAPGTRVGLLATSATVEARLYHQALEPFGLEVLVPDARGQRRVDDAIYPPHGIKAGRYRLPRRWLLAEARRLTRRGAAVVVAGCTEIPLVLGPRDVPSLLDPTEVLAWAVVREALGEKASAPPENPAGSSPWPEEEGRGRGPGWLPEEGRGRRPGPRREEEGRGAGIAATGRGGLVWTVPAVTCGRGGRGPGGRGGRGGREAGTEG